MPRRTRTLNREPKVGDFILWDDKTWTIDSISRGGKIVAYSSMDIGLDEPEEFFIDSLAPTSIKTWETE